MNYYPRHLGDYASDAGYLSALEHGVYNLLLDWYYKNERPIPRELAYQICKATSPAEKKAVIKVLDAFFKWNPTQGHCHKRVEEELAKMREKSAKASNSAKHRWKVDPMQKHSNGDANAMLSNNQYPITNNQKTKTAAISSFSSNSISSSKGMRSSAEILRGRFSDEGED